MFIGKTFYHNHVRNAIVAFGTILNNLRIERTDKNGISQNQIIDVPLTYGPKQKFITRIIEAKDFEDGRAPFAVTLPRIGFFIEDMVYDSGRKLAPIKQVASVRPDGAANVAFISTPYNLKISATVYVKNQEDGLQIIEQIVPYFSPDFNVTINEIPELGITRDLQIVLDSVHCSDNFEGIVEERRFITWDLKFTLKMNFFGHVDRSAMIKKVIQNLYLNLPPEDSGVRITTAVDPASAGPTDNYDVVTDIFDIPVLE